MKTFYSFLVFAFCIFLQNNNAYSQTANDCTINPGHDTSICCGNTMTLHGFAGGNTVLSTVHWTQLSGPSAVIVTPNQLVSDVMYNSSNCGSTYAFLLTATCANGTVYSDTVSIYVGNPVVANAGADQTFCLNGTLHPVGSLPPPLTATWTLVTPTPSNSIVLLQSFSQSGNNFNLVRKRGLGGSTPTIACQGFDARLVVQDGGCRDDDTVHVNFVAPDIINIINITDNATYCMNSILLNGTFPGCGEQAEFTITPLNGQPAPTIVSAGYPEWESLATFTATGAYSITYHYIGSGLCSDQTITKVFSIGSLTAPHIAVNNLLQLYCDTTDIPSQIVYTVTHDIGAVVTFNPFSGGGIIGGAVTITAIDPTHTLVTVPLTSNIPPNSTQFVFRIRVEVGGCVAEVEPRIIMGPQVTVSSSVIPVICNNSDFRIRNFVSAPGTAIPFQATIVNGPCVQGYAFCPGTVHNIYSTSTSWNLSEVGTYEVLIVAARTETINGVSVTCADSATVTIISYGSLGTINAGTGEGCVNTSLQLLGTLPPNPFVNVQWTQLDNNPPVTYNPSNTTSSPFITASAPGTYSFEYRFTANNDPTCTVAAVGNYVVKTCCPMLPVSVHQNCNPNGTVTITAFDAQNTQILNNSPIPPFVNGQTDIDLIMRYSLSGQPGTWIGGVQNSMNIPFGASYTVVARYYVYNNGQWVLQCTETQNGIANSCACKDLLPATVSVSCNNGIVTLTALDKNGQVLNAASNSVTVNWIINGNNVSDQNPVVGVAQNGNAYTANISLQTAEGVCNGTVSGVVNCCPPFNFQIDYCKKAEGDHCDLCESNSGTIWVQTANGNHISNGYSFVWNTGATTPSITGGAGQYSVTVTSNTTGCKEVFSLNIVCCNAQAVPTGLSCETFSIPPIITSANLNWLPVAGANNYQVALLFNDPACGCTPGPQTSANFFTTSTTFSVPSNSLNRCFSWKIKARCASTGQWTTFSAKSCYPKGCSNFIIGKETEGEAENNVATTDTQLADLYPNPTNGIVNIYGGAVVPGNTICVFNTMGMTVFKRDITEEEMTEIDLSDYSKGLYIIVIQDKTNKVVVSKRLLKE